MTELARRCERLLTTLDLMPDGGALKAEALTGGVASDIAKVTVNETIYCVKFALAKLRVKADWYAPVERNYAEYRWLKLVNDILPDASLTLYGHCDTEHGFVMDYIDGQDSYLLKTALFEGRGQSQQAAMIGDLLGRIHQSSTKSDFDTQPFHNRDDFYALRLEPYLIHTAKQHADIADALQDMSSRLYKTDNVLIHGDVSPKNIIFDGGRAILLDAECATMGDACFDIAFCLNHFILKGLYLPAYRARYFQLCDAFWQAYQPYVTWEDKQSLEERVSRLLPMLMLARCDGKSPVEYFDDTHKDICRLSAISLIRTPQNNLSSLIDILKTHHNETPE